MKVVCAAVSSLPVSAHLFPVSFDTSTLVTDLLSMFSTHLSAAPLCVLLLSASLHLFLLLLLLRLSPSRLFKSIKFTGGSRINAGEAEDYNLYDKKRMRVECQG